MLLPPALKAGPADATVGRDGFPDCRDDLIEGLGFDPVKDEGLQLIVALNLGRCTGQVQTDMRGKRFAEGFKGAI